MKKSSSLYKFEFLNHWIGIFLYLFVDPIPKNDKNPNLMIKNSSLYKLEFTILLPFPDCLINIMDGLMSFELHPSLLNVAMKLIIIVDKVVDFLEMVF